MCLATEVLGMFVPLRLFLEKRIPQISKELSASSDGGPLFYCLSCALWVSPFAPCLVVSHPLHPLHPAPHIPSSSCKCGPPSLFTSGAMSEATATQERGEAQAAASLLPFPRCISVPAEVAP